MSDFEINNSPFTFDDDSAPLNNEPLEFSGSVGFSDTLTNLTGHDNDFLSTDGVDLVWATFAATNGLTYDADNYSLTFGGTLTKNTSINGGAYDIDWTNMGAFDISSNSSDIDVAGTLEIGRAFSTAKRSIKFNTSVIEVTDFDAGVGLVYAGDYSTAGTANDRWLPDYAAVKAYLNDKFTFGSGLTNTADSIRLGGILTADTTISGAAGAYDFNLSSLDDFTLGFDMAAIITDNNGIPKGLQYHADYTSTFTTRSLVDKGYVDNKFTFENGLTDTTGTITLGGTLNSNTTIDGSTGTYDFSFNNLDGFALDFDNTAIVTDSNGTPKGLQYAADYSSSFATHSLVDKAYVDSIAVSGITWKESVIEILNFTTNEPSATSGDRYINSATGNSSVTTQAMTANYIYEWDGATWVETIPADGDTLNVNTDSVTPPNEIGWHNYDGSNWTFIGGVTAHNDTSSIQGGITGERYHLTAAQHTIAGRAATTTTSGFLTSTDWNTFNNKLDASAYTAADVLSKIKIVDGAGSGLNADLLDGNSSAAFAALSDNETIAGQWTFSDSIILKTGTATDMSLYFNGDSDTGIYSGAANTFYFRAGAINTVKVDASGLNITGSVGLSGELDFGDWTLNDSTTNMIWQYSAATKSTLANDGTLTLTGDVIAYG